MPGQMIPRGGDRWLLRVYAGRDRATGKRLYKSRSFRGGRNEARAALDEFLRDRGARADGGTTTVGEHLDAWLRTVARNRYAYKTFCNYRLCLNNDLRRELGGVRLADLRPEHVQQVLDAIEAPRRVVEYATAIVFGDLDAVRCGGRVGHARRESDGARRDTEATAQGDDRAHAG